MLSLLKKFTKLGQMPFEMHLLEHMRNKFHFIFFLQELHLTHNNDDSSSKALH